MKYAIVTGGTKGIGRAISEMLLTKGYFVFVNYSNDEAAATEFIKTNIQYKDRIKLIKQELSTYENALLFVQEIESSTEHISVIILNAGVTDRTDFCSISKESWDYVINTNVSIPFFLVQKLARNIVDGEGRIIFIGSVCGQLPHSVSIAYGVSKAAVHQMSKELVKFFSLRKITVNTIVPGFIDTPWQSTKTVEHRKRIEEKTAMNRFGKPEEVASLCLEVINNPYINGANLNIDGGYCYR